jgi:hypothetical protein
MTRRSHPALRAARLVGGGLLLVGGVAGLVLPVLPGWVLIIPGLGLWSHEFAWAARLRHRVRSELVARGIIAPRPDRRDEQPPRAA